MHIHTTTCNTLQAHSGVCTHPVVAQISHNMAVVGWGSLKGSPPRIQHLAVAHPIPSYPHATMHKAIPVCPCYRVSSSSLWTRTMLLAVPLYSTPSAAPMAPTAAGNPSHLHPIRPVAAPTQQQQQQSLLLLLVRVVQCSGPGAAATAAAGCHVCPAFPAAAAAGGC
jgi:hypothetical protein